METIALTAIQMMEGMSNDYLFGPVISKFKAIVVFMVVHFGKASTTIHNLVVFSESGYVWHI